LHLSGRYLLIGARSDDDVEVGISPVHCDNLLNEGRPEAVLIVLGS